MAKIKEEEIMIKIIFVLVINIYHGGLTTIDFTTKQQCETAKEQVRKTEMGGSTIHAVCIEKQVPIKKTKCKITNETVKFVHGYLYPYPVALECVEE